MKKLQEYEDAKLLAQQIIDRTDEDPDSTEMILSRQFLRQVETVNILKKDLEAAHDPTIDLVLCNQSSLLEKHEEAISIIRGHLSLGRENDGIRTLIERVTGILMVLDRLAEFHPMHAEDWKGWPE